MRVGVGVLILAGLASIPLLLRSDQIIKASAVGVYAIIGLSLVVLTGWAGQISLGQMGFVAIGAAVAGKCTAEWNLDLNLALLAAGAAGAVAAFAVGLPALRLRGLYLAVTTLVFALAVSSWLLNDLFFGWVPRQRLERPPLFGRIDISTPTRYYVYTLVVTAIIYVALRGIRHSRPGRAIVGLRENERAAQAYAVRPVPVKLTAFTISGTVAGIAGGLYVHLTQSFDIVTYGPRASLDVFTAGVVGGLGSLFGGVLGAIFLRGTQWFITDPAWQFLSSAVGVLLVLLILPGGLASLVIKLRDRLVGYIVAREPRRDEPPVFDVGTVLDRIDVGPIDSDVPSERVASVNGERVRERHRNLDRERRSHQRQRGEGRHVTSTATAQPDGQSLPPIDDPSMWRRFQYGLAHPMEWLRGICGGEAAFPLLVLFGLNAVDELDRTAFGILLPNIREAFNLDLTSALSIVALSSVAALALQVPIAQFADRSKRVPLVIGGALAWAFFSGMTGLSVGVIMLTVARSGSSLGKAFIDPTHNSLIADYYPVETRSHVFSFHRAANAVGGIIGPISAGMLAYWFGWRVPFIVFVIPTVIFAVLALEAARADPRPLGAARDRCLRRDHQHRGDGAIVLRELAHGAQGPFAPPDLVEPSVPRRLTDRLHHARVTLLRAGVQPE